MPSYKSAVDWIYSEEDISEIVDPSVPVEEAALIAPVTVTMVAQLWGRETVSVVRALRYRERQRVKAK